MATDVPTFGQWRLETIPAQVRGLTDEAAVGSTPIPDVTVPVAHWCDLIRAMAWFRYARALLDAFPRQTFTRDVPVIFYLNLVVMAIANGYNCLNICWYLDPAARRLYRAYLAGPPRSAYGAPAAEYGDHTDYSDAWYNTDDGKYHAQQDLLSPKPDQRMPYSAGLFYGSIPAAAQARYLATNPGRLGLTTHFAPTLGMYLAPPLGAPPSRPGLRACYQTECINVPGMGYQPPNAPGPYVATRLQGDGPFPSNPDCRLPDGATCAEAYPDGSTQPDAQYFNGDEFTAPARAYLAWLDAWLAAVLARTMEQVVLDARYYTVFVNAKQAAQIGPAFLHDAGVTDAYADQQQHAADPGWRTVGSTAQAIGGALAPWTFGISAIIGGLVNVGVALGDGLATHDVNDVYRDDLGRFKPTVERGWLGGTGPGDPSSAGAPGFTVLDAPPLPGGTVYDRLRGRLQLPGGGAVWMPVLDPLALAKQTPRLTKLPAAPPSSGGLRTALIASAAVGVVAAAGYGLSHLFSPKGPSSR